MVLYFAAEIFTKQQTCIRKVNPSSRLDCFPDAGFYCLFQNRLRLGARTSPRYSMLFRDSVMLMFSSRLDMAMLTMKAKTKVRITASA